LGNVEQFRQVTRKHPSKALSNYEVYQLSKPQQFNEHTPISQL